MSRRPGKVHGFERRRERASIVASRLIKAIQREASRLVHESRAAGEIGCFVLHHENAEERLRAREGYKPIGVKHEIPSKVIDHVSHGGAPGESRVTRTVIYSWPDVARVLRNTQPEIMMAKDVEWLCFENAASRAPRLIPALLSYDTRYECLLLVDPPSPELGEWIHVVQHGGVHQHDGSPSCNVFFVADAYTFEDLVSWSKAGEDPRNISWSDPQYEEGSCSYLAEACGVEYEFKEPDGSYVAAGTNLNAVQDASDKGGS